jgi:hypothetical protein
MGIKDGKTGAKGCPERQRLSRAVFDAGKIVASSKAEFDKALRNRATDRLSLLERLNEARKAHSKAINDFHVHRIAHEC